MNTILLITSIALLTGSIFISQGFAQSENLFYGSSSFEKIPPPLIIGKPTELEIKFQYTAGPYGLNNFSPVIEVSPDSASSKISVKVEPLEGISQGQVVRIPVTITVDKTIEHEKIFLSVFFTGEHFITDSFYKSAWTDSVTLDISPKDIIGIPLGDCYPIDIEYTISGGDVFTVCKSQDTISIKAIVNADSEGIVTFDIPEDVLISLTSKDCDTDNDFVIIMDGKEIPSRISNTQSGNLVTVDFTDGIHEIEIIGFTILPDPTPAQYCGIVEGYYKKFLPPLDQLDKGVKPEFIRCNADLILIHKIDGSPACVKPETKTKLIQRGWTITNDDDLSFNVITPESTHATFYVQPQHTSVILKQDSTVRVHLFSYLRESPSGEWDHVFNRAFDEVPKNFEIGIVESTPENIKEFATRENENLPHGIQTELSREGGYFVVYLSSDKSLNLGKYVLSVVSVDKKTGSIIEKPLHVIAVEEPTTSTQDNIIRMYYSKGSWGINLSNISEHEYWIREDGRFPWPPSPILDITDDNIHPHVKQLIDAMWGQDAKYVPSKYDQNILMVENAGSSLNVEPTEIRDWLRSTHDHQFQRNLDDSFSSYIQYNDKLYSFEFIIFD